MPVPVVRHLNCGNHGPRGARLITGEGGVFDVCRFVCHVLVVELRSGYALIDAGFGTDDIRKRNRAATGYKALVRTPHDVDETALMQLRNLGIEPGDISHIVLTHLDIDHSGGLPDFPDAEVHLSARELAVAQRPPLRERVRYASAAQHWAHGPRWVPHETAGEEWFGFENVRSVPGTDDDMLLVPLPGHTHGHVGVAVRQADGWLLHCGDAFYHRDEMSTPPRGPVGVRVMQTLIQADGDARRRTQAQLRSLHHDHGDQVTLFCAHDRVMFGRAVKTSSDP